MTAGDLVSVVIPTYNRADLVGTAIDSALAQTHANVEVIVVDDGSTDDTGGVIARRYGGDPRVIYLHQENRGVSAARNAGFRRVRGSFVGLLDSDDVWKPWKVELQLRGLDRFPEAGMIWTDMEAVGPDDRVIDPHFLRTMYRAAYRWFPTAESLFASSAPLDSLSCPGLPPGTSGRVYCGDISSQMVMGNLVHTSTVLLRRARLEQVGCFDEALRMGEDYGFHLRTCQAGPVAFADVPSIRYQLGRLDHLGRSEHGIHIARNFLNTIEPVIKQGRHRVNLPDSMLASVQAEAHAWIGRESLAQGDSREARKHLVESLRHRMVPSTLLLLAVSCGPDRTFPTTRKVVQAAKRALRRP